MMTTVIISNTKMTFILKNRKNDDNDNKHNNDNADNNDDFQTSNTKVMLKNWNTSHFDRGRSQPRQTPTTSCLEPGSSPVT